MSLHDEIEAMNDVFFDAEGFAEEVTFVPQGVTANQYPLLAVVDWNYEEGQNQIRGEGRAGLNKDRGRSVRRSVVIEMPTTRVFNGAKVPVTVLENGKDRIITKLHGSSDNVTLNVKRLIGRDASTLSVLCVATEVFETQPYSGRTG